MAVLSKKQFNKDESTIISMSNDSSKSRLNKITQRLKHKIKNASPLDKYKYPVDDSIHIKESFLKIVSFNCGKMKSDLNKRNLVKHLIIREDPDVILLQETNLDDNVDFNIEGYQDPVKNSSGAGTLYMVKETIMNEKIKTNIDLGKNLENQIFKLTLNEGQELYIINIYRNGNAQATLNAKNLFKYMENKKNVITMGDFNAHNPIWRTYNDKSNNLKTCQTGRLIEEALNETSVICLNTGEATHAKGGAIDLAFSTKNLSTKATFQVNDMNVSGNDHFGITVFVQLAKVPKLHKKPKKIYEKADWDIYRNEIDSYISNNNLLTENTEEITDNLQTLNDLNDKLVDMFQSAEKQAIPLSTPSNSNRITKGIQTPKTREMTHRINMLTKALKSAKNIQEKDNIKNALNATKVQAKTVIGTESTNKLLQWTEKLNSSSSLTEMWSHIKQMSGNSPPNLHPDPVYKANELIEHFSKRSSDDNLTEVIKEKLNEQKPHRLDTIKKALNTSDSELCRPYNDRELKRAIKNSISGPGYDEVTHVLLYQASELGHKLILKIANISHNLGKEATAWKLALITPIQKSNGSYRPISLLSVIGKLIERMLLNRLTYKIPCLKTYLYAYTKGRGCQDLISTILHDLSQNNNKNTYIAATFLDVKQAFEMMNKETILYKLAKLNVTGKSLAWIGDFLTNRRAQVNFQGVMSKELTFQNGTPQGSVLSAFLFNIVMDELLEQLNLKEYPNSIAYCYADDLVIISKTSNENHLKETMETNLLNLENITNSLGMILEPSKTVNMMFYRKDPSFVLKLYDNKLKWVNEHKFLGIIFDKKLTFKAHIEYLISRCLKRINIMKSLTTVKGGANFKVLRTYYLQAIRSIIDYSAPAIILAKPNLIKKLEIIQNSALRIITGAPPWTKIINMLYETNIASIKDRITQLTANLIMKTVTNKESRLKNEILNKSNSSFLKTTSFTTRYIDTSVMDSKELLFRIPPWDEPKASFIIKEIAGGKTNYNKDKTKKIYRKEISRLNKENDIIIYTDGSVDPTAGNSGSAAVFKNKNGKTLYSIKARARNHCSSMETELLAIIIALMNCIQKSDLKDDKIIIHTDSLSALQNIKNIEPTDNVELTNKIHSILHNIFINGGKVTFHWIPSHTDIYGNDQADIAAKQAANKSEIDFYNIPKSLAEIKKSIKHQISSSSRPLQHQILASNSLSWYTTANQKQIDITKLKLNRIQEISFLKLKLGYPNYNHISNNDNFINCKYCRDTTNEPFYHYITECPYSSPVFMTHAKNIPQHGISFIERHKYAATLVYQTFNYNLQQLLQIIKKFPIQK